jgi:hypothetical protein
MTNPRDPRLQPSFSITQPAASARPQRQPAAHVQAALAQVAQPYAPPRAHSPAAHVQASVQACLAVGAPPVQRQPPGGMTRLPVPSPARQATPRQAPVPVAPPPPPGGQRQAPPPAPMQAHRAALRRPVVVQRYTEELDKAGTWRISDDGKMAVKQGDRYKGSQELYLADNVQIAPNILLKTTEKLGSLYCYKLKPKELPANCGEACSKVMRTIRGWENEGTQRIVTFNKENLLCNDPMVTRKWILERKPSQEHPLNENARPQLGDAYAVGVDEEEKKKNDFLFNFHWATVIATSGNDVVTVENAGSSTTNGWWFQIYSQHEKKVKDQSFHSHYHQFQLIGNNGLTMQVGIEKKQKTEYVEEIL